MRTKGGLKRRAAFSQLSLLVILLTASACTNGLTPTAQSRCPEGQPIHEDLHYKIAALGPFDMDKRQVFHTVLNDAANRLWHSSSSVELKKQKVARSTEFPVLILLDRDKDGRPDEFAYVPDKGPHFACHVFFLMKEVRVTASYGLSQDFGFIFDLNKDGKVDYIIFNGGPIQTKKETVNREELNAYLNDWFDGSQSSGLVMWENYHLIDSNGDAKIDIAVYNAVDLNQDRLPDEGVTAWVYDTNFDGVFDRGEYLAKDFQKDMERKDGVLILQRRYGGIAQFGPGDKAFAGFDKILFDVNSFSR